MTPLERVIPLTDIAKIRVECGSCHTTAAFPVRGGNINAHVGERCPFCMHEWEGVVERIFFDIVKSVERNSDVKKCSISLELAEAF